MQVFYFILLVRRALSSCTRVVLCHSPPTKQPSPPPKKTAFFSPKNGWLHDCRVTQAGAKNRYSRIESWFGVIYF